MPMLFETKVLRHNIMRYQWILTSLCMKLSKLDKLDFLALLFLVKFLNQLIQLARPYHPARPLLCPVYTKTHKVQLQRDGLVSYLGWKVCPSWVFPGQRVKPKIKNTKTIIIIFDGSFSNLVCMMPVMSFNESTMKPHINVIHLVFLD